jgi:hypothetical protein
MASARGSRLILSLLLAAAVLPGCASLPDKGPVREGLRLQVDRDESAVRPIGQPPVAGARPDIIVRGFLRAGADFDNNHQVARQYLAPSIRQRWRATTGTVIYNRAEGDLSVIARGDGKIAVNAAEVARIKSDGQYVGAPTGGRVERIFELSKVSGEWRISKVDDGLLLARTTVGGVYRQLNVYFLSKSAKVLVPDTIFLPALPGLATQLVTRLLRGPTSALRGAVTTGFPTGSSLAFTSVPISEVGVASVRLDATAARADDENRVTMSAQLVWTLKQLPEFRALRLTLDDELLTVSGSPDAQPRDNWLTYDPDALRADVTPYAVRDGRAGLFVQKKFVPLGGALGDGSLPSRSVAVSLDLTRVAVVTADGRSLFVGRLRPAGAPSVRLRGADLASPSWDSLGNVWIAERRTGRLWLVPPGDGQPVPVALDDFAAAGPVTAVRVARDGARAALVAGAGAASRLYVGAVLRDGEESAVRVTALREVLPELHNVRDVAWVDATKLAVIGRLDEDADVPVVTDTAGYEILSIELEPGLVSIAAAPAAHPIVAGTESGRVQQYTASGEWEPLGAGINPAYPG